MVEEQVKDVYSIPKEVMFVSRTPKVSDIFLLRTLADSERCHWQQFLSKKKYFDILWWEWELPGNLEAWYSSRDNEREWRVLESRMELHVQMIADIL